MRVRTAVGGTNGGRIFEPCVSMTSWRPPYWIFSDSSVHLCSESTLYLLLFFCACSWDVLLAEACKQPCSKPAQVKVCVAKDKTLCGLILGPIVDLLMEGCGESGVKDIKNSAFSYISSVLEIQFPK